MSTEPPNSTDGMDSDADRTLPMGAVEPTDADSTIPISDAPLRPATPLPDFIGSYKVLGKLGEGGMGVVYEAEQQNPKRKVALKVIRGGALVDDMQVRLFQREAETLARLKHPNIGSIFESGCTEGGQHFFAMELVRGRTLDEYLAGHSRPLPDDEVVRRIRIFQVLCDAVHYAHQRGVIHRDLKPSNVVVTEADADATPQSGTHDTHGAVAKILDFGLARITDQDVAAASMVSDVGVIKGTLSYMSPEQARGIPDEIDLRTDIYTLGMILYEMLTEARPYDLGSVSIPDAIRVICDAPPKSLRVKWDGKSDLDKDLETIVHKSLEKDPNDRYKSAAGFSGDLERYLTDQPIMARPPSTVYTLRKFAKRNKVLVGGAVATGLTLIAGIVVSTTLGLREASQRRVAQEARQSMERVADFQSRMLQDVDVEQMGLRLLGDLRTQLDESLSESGKSAVERAQILDQFDARLRLVNSTDLALGLLDEGILARAEQTVEEEFSAQPEISARLDRTLGNTYFRLGLMGKAEALLLRSIESYRNLGAGFEVEVAAGQRYLAQNFLYAGHLDAAEPMILAALEAHEPLGELHPEVLEDYSILALLRREQQDWPRALEAYQTVVDRDRRSPDLHPGKVLSDLDGLAWVYLELGRFAEAESIQVAALADARRELGPEAETTMALINNLAVCFVRQGRLVDAEPLYLEELDASRRRLGNEHQETTVSITNTGRLYLRMKRYEDAEPLLREAVETGRRLAPGTFGRGIAMESWGKCLLEMGRIPEAEVQLLQAWDVFVALMGEDFIGSQKTAESLVRVYESRGDEARREIWVARAGAPATQD